MSRSVQIGMMKDRKKKYCIPILAAGGIVLRNDFDFAPRFAVVRSRKLAAWGLPKGKLATGEDAVTAARREVIEETGHHVTVHEFLGTLVHETSSRTKVIQFWRMEAAGAPAGDLMRDVTAVDWLALEDAIDRLSHLRERLFLEQVGPIAVELAERSAGAGLFRQHDVGRIRDADRILVPGVPLTPADDVSLSDGAGECPLVKSAAERGLSERRLSELSFRGKTLMKKTWGWFRHAAPRQRQPLDES